MSNEKKPKKTKEEKAEAAIEKLASRKLMLELGDKDSEWTPLQNLMQEIVATYLVVDPDRKVSARMLIKSLREKIEHDYSSEEDEEKKKILLEAIPSERSVRDWVKKKGWDQAVWDKIRDAELFSNSKRAEMIEALRHRGLTKSDTAAKIWLTLSGDYSDKMDINSDSTMDTFREINKQIHKKNN